MKAKTLTLNHPMWSEPREFGIEHANNILELEKVHPSGIYQVQDNNSDNVIDTSTSSGNTEGQKTGKSGNRKSRKARK